MVEKEKVITRKWLISGDEIAAYMGFCLDTIRSLRKKDGLPVKVVAGRLRAHPDDLDRWLSER